MVTNGFGEFHTDCLRRIVRRLPVRSQRRRNDGHGPISTLLTLVMGPKSETVDSAEQMLRQILFDKMDEADKEKFAKHCQKSGITPDEFVKTRAEGAVKSVENGRVV